MPVGLLFSEVKPGRGSLDSEVTAEGVGRGDCHSASQSGPPARVPVGGDALTHLGAITRNVTIILNFLFLPSVLRFPLCILKHCC